MNVLKTTMLMVVLTMILVFIGSFWGTEGMVFALIFSLGMNLFMYWFSDKMVLMMYRARPVTPQEAPQLYQMVAELTQNAGLPMPKLYIIPTDTPNAFATGRNPNHAAIAVTEGILRILDYNELKGVLAHELAHVKNRDMLIGTIAAGIAGAVMMLARMAQFAAMFGGVGGRNDREGNNPLALLVMIIVAPLAALLVQLWISRTREYEADATGARFAKNADGLANALYKLEQAAKLLPMNANPSTAHLFIVNPLSGRSFLTLFSTHPPISERIKRLRAMSLTELLGAMK
ncbi:MAG: zinc metalloprotease HtpX [bacterium]|nr:zinc metalloprotease HtpX [bacterium]